jgi:hypothetical protein
MENRLTSHFKAFAELIRAALAMRDGHYGDAVDLMRDSVKRREGWTGRLMLAQLYLATKHYGEARGELDICVKRSGEAADPLFFDLPSVHNLPQLYYYLARTNDAIGSPTARTHWAKYLELRGDADPADPWAAEARRALKTAAK